MELCDRCLGRRLIGAQGEAPQGEAARAHRAETGAGEVETRDCPVCEGCFAESDRWLEAALRAVAPWEFSTFQVGTVFPAACEAAEKRHMDLNAEIGDTVRTEANRLLAPQLEEATGARVVADRRPDLVLNVDTRFWSAEVDPNSVYLLGRYTKHRRDLPQTHWPCKTCQGLGCYACDDRGVEYEQSVEQAVGDVVGPAHGATAYAFHGAGREDIDALMIGTGRPFVLELKDARRRRLADDHLAALVQAVQEAKPESGVGVLGLEYVDKDKVQEVKAGAYNKEYLAHCAAEADVSRPQVEAAVQELTGAVLDQRTPQRVSHRRADKVRQRRVHHMVLEDMPDARHFSVRVLADAGAYIKEMVHGDDGRTTPSLAHLLGVPCRVDLLDVVAVLDE